MEFKAIECGLELEFREWDCEGVKDLCERRGMDVIWSEFCASVITGFDGGEIGLDGGVNWDVCRSWVDLENQESTLCDWKKVKDPLVKDI